MSLEEWMIWRQNRVILRALRGDSLISCITYSIDGSKASHAF